MSDTGFTASEREKMVCVMDLNCYEQDGKGPRFISLDSGEVLEFPNWAQVFEFIKAHFASRNDAGNGGRKKCKYPLAQETENML